MREAGKKTAAIAATAAVALAAGCGGGSRLSKPDYEQKVKNAGTKFEAAFVSAGVCGPDILEIARTGKGDLNALASLAGSLQKHAGKFADELDSLKPPKDAEADHQGIADFMHREADGLGDVKAAAANGDWQKVRAVGQRLEGVSGPEAYIDDLEKKGYDLGPLGSDAPDPCE